MYFGLYCDVLFPLARTYHAFKLPGPWPSRAALALRPGPRNVGTTCKVHADWLGCRDFRKFRSVEISFLLPEILALDFYYCTVWASSTWLVGRSILASKVLGMEDNLHFLKLLRHIRNIFSSPPRGF